MDHEAKLKADARQLRERGWAITWIRKGEKRPTVKAWTKRSQEPEEYTPGASLGLQTGAISAGLVCIDVDAEAYLEPAARILPPTAMRAGRPGKPRSHYFYVVEGDIPPHLTAAANVGVGGGPRTRRAPKLDFQGTGAQVVVPPSSHPSGEVRTWYDVGGNPTDAPGEPARIQYAELQAAFERLALETSGWTDKHSPAAAPPRPALDGAPDAAVNVDTAPADRAERTERARRYVEAIEGAVSGQGGHQQTFKVAAVLVRDFGLTDDEATPIFRGWNAKCVPPWDGDELLRKLSEARANARGVPGSKANAPAPADTFEAFNDGHRLARGFLATVSGLIYWRSEFHEYDGTRYRPLPWDDLRPRLATYCKREFDKEAARQRRQAEQEHAAAVVAYSAVHEANQNGSRKPPQPPKARPAPQVDGGVLARVRVALEAETLRTHVIEQPAWLGDDGPRSLLAFRNGLVDVDALLRGGATIEPHSPLWFSPVCLPYDYRQDADCPRWRAVLGRCLEGDGERIALLQEWAGYLLTPDTSLQKFMLLYGPGGNGKGVVCAVLTALLGAENVSAVALDDFGNDFTFAQTFGRLANISTEIGNPEKVAEGRLKAVVSGDALTLNRKHKDVLSVRPTARLMFATNERPRFRDRSDGVWRRLLLLPFNVKITEAEKVAGMDSPAYWHDELPGILNWAVAGLRRLRERRRFTEPAVCRQEAAAYREETNPALMFLQDECGEAAGKAVECQELYRRFAEWCRDKGYQPLNEGNFGKEVKSRHPDAERRQVRLKGGRGGTERRVWMYFGLRLNDQPNARPLVTNGNPFLCALLQAGLDWLAVNDPPMHAKYGNPPYTLGGEVSGAGPSGIAIVNPGLSPVSPDVTSEVNSLVTT